MIERLMALLGPDCEEESVAEGTKTYPVSIYGHPRTISLKAYRELSAEERSAYALDHAPKCCVCGGYLLTRETDKVRRYCLSCNSEYELRGDSWFITKMDPSERTDKYSIIRLGNEKGFLSEFKRLLREASND